jgi:hypothetical protein
MFNNSANLKYHVFEDYNINFDEHMSTCGTVRKIQWVKEGTEPDINKAKIEIRKIKIDETGETTLKGYSFSSPEGVHELAEGLVSAGFGDTKNILNGIKNREDFKDVVQSIYNGEDEEEQDPNTFNMKDFLLGISSSDSDLDNVIKESIEEENYE